MKCCLLNEGEPAINNRLSCHIHYLSLTYHKQFRVTQQKSHTDPTVMRKEAPLQTVAHTIKLNSNHNINLTCLHKGTLGKVTLPEITMGRPGQMKLKRLVYLTTSYAHSYMASFCYILLLKWSNPFLLALHKFLLQ